MLDHEYEEAEQCFQKVLELEPENKAAVGQRQACVRKIKEQERKERKLYKNMFTKLANMRGEEEEQEVEEERYSTSAWSCVAPQLYWPAVL